LRCGCSAGAVLGGGEEHATITPAARIPNATTIFFMDDFPGQVL
jgi:hypothetical protein